MTDPIKAKIIELCPDVTNEREWSITLAVVLRAIQKALPHIDKNYIPTWLGETSNFYSLWNLEKDWDGQTRETQLFVGTLLGVATN